MNCLRGMLLLLIGVGLHTVMPRMYALAGDDLQFRWEKKGDVFIVNGSQLVLNCTNSNASASYADVSQLKILKGSENISATYQHTFWEDRTLQVHIPRAQISDSATYVCMDGVNIPKLMMVKIGVEPSLPENITCISENFQNLVCSFNKPSTTYIPMKWYMEYSFDGPDFSTSTVNGSCPLTEDKLVVVHCSLNGNPDTYAQYQVTLHMYNTLYGLSKKMTVEVVVDESIVRPNVVDNLIVTQLENSRRVIISWSHPHDLPDTVELIYCVTLRNQWGEQKSLVTTNNTSELTDPIPYTTYIFEVNCKPINAVGEVYWSTPANRTLTTRPALPNKGPIVNDGAFALRNCGTENICVVLYWKNPPAREINGKLVGYTIIIASGMKIKKIKREILYIMNHENQNHVCRGRNELPCTERIRGECTSAEVSFHLPNHTDVVAGIALRNTVGLSKPSFIVISAFEQAPKPDLVIVEEGESNFQVSWMWEKNLSVTTVTYFWCTMNRLRANTTLLCEGTLGTYSVQNSTSLDWKSFTLNRNNVSISASNQSSLYFAVALVQNETSGGMVWQGCKFLKGKAPNKPAYHLNQVETNGTLLEIEIPRDLLCQADNAGRPETYTVSYKQVVDGYKEGACPQDGFSNETFEVQLEREIQHYTLSGLIEGGNYILCLGSANRDSQTIQYGSSMVAKTTQLGVSKSKSSSSVISTIIIIAAVSSTVIIFVVSYFCLRRLRRCMKRPAIIVPDVHHFKKEEVHAGLDDIYIEVDGRGKMGSKASEFQQLNNKNGGLDADSGTGGSVESSCSGDDIEETKYVAPERRDSGTSSARSASYNRLVQTTSSGNLIKAYEQSLYDRSSSDCLMKFAQDIITDPKIITRQCNQVFLATAASGSARNSSDQSYVVATLQEGRNSSEYLYDTDLDRLKHSQKETLKPCTDNPITTLPLKSPTALQVKLNTGRKEHSEPQSMAETMTIIVVQNPYDGSYVQATLEEKEADKKEEEVNTEEFEGQEEMETSWEENRRINHHLESLDDGLVDLAIEYLLDSGSLPVVNGYVKTIETNLGSGAFSISDSSSGLSETLMPIYIKPAEVSLTNNQYLSGGDLSNDEIAKIEEIPWDLKSGEPQQSSKCQRQSFQNNAASYIQETPGISIFKSHSRDETCSECLLRDEGPASLNSKCQSNDRTSAVNAYTCGCNFNSKEESNSCLNECNLENEISLRGGTPELTENMFYMQKQTCGMMNSESELSDETSV